MVRGGQESQKIAKFNANNNIINRLELLWGFSLELEKGKSCDAAGWMGSELVGCQHPKSALLGLFPLSRWEGRGRVARWVPLTPCVPQVVPVRAGGTRARVGFPVGARWWGQHLSALPRLGVTVSHLRTPRQPSGCHVSLDDAPSALRMP